MEKPASQRLPLLSYSAAFCQFGQGLSFLSDLIIAGCEWL